MLKREAAADDASRRRFETEARAASKLAHPNLIAVHDYGFTEENTPYLIMDYLEGQSLSSLLKEQGRLDAPRVIAITRQLCAGLGHAHHKGLVHRDLKPTNVLLLTEADGQEIVKIVDFGIVKPITADQELTETGQIFGTPYYMSPEQCQGKKLDGRSDIYALGCLMYRMLVGKPPFTGDNPVTTILMHIKEPPPAIPEQLLTSETARDLAAIIMRTLAKEPEARYQTVDELRVELERIEQGQSLTIKPNDKQEFDEIGSLRSSYWQQVMKSEAWVVTVCGSFVLLLIVGSYLCAMMIGAGHSGAASGKDPSSLHGSSPAVAPEQTVLPDTARPSPAPADVSDAGVDLEAPVRSRVESAVNADSSATHRPAADNASAHSSTGDRTPEARSTAERTGDSVARKAHAVRHAVHHARRKRGILDKLRGVLDSL